MHKFEIQVTEIMEKNSSIQSEVGIKVVSYITTIFFLEYRVQNSPSFFQTQSRTSN